MMDEFINRRIWDKENGLSYFCSICGKYKPEKDFYKSKRSMFGVETRCKLHFTKREKDSLPGEDSHLKFSRLTKKDFLGARDLLHLLGYDTNSDVSVHQQFLTKHNLKK
jgi:hypothetical protein